MNRKHIIVTGGYGFIGSRFVKYVVENTDYNVVLIDCKTYAADPKRISSWLDPVKYHGRILHCVEHIADPKLNEKIGGLFSGASYVVNFAAETHVDNSISDGSPFMKTNVRGVYNLLEICRNHCSDLKRFVQVSTDEVYGDMDDVRGSRSGADESFPLRPSSYYSASKASGDLLVQSCARTYGLPFLITRCCNNYGPGQHPEKFLPKLIKCVKSDTPIPVYGQGTQVREWIHVDEHVEKIYKLMHMAPANEIYNIGSPQAFTNISIILHLQESLRKPVEYTHVEDRLGHDKRYSIDCEKLQQLIPVTDNYYEELLSFLEFELADEYITR